MPQEPGARPKRHIVFRTMNRLMDTAAWLCVAGVLVVVMLQIVFRELGRPLVWTEETSRFLFMWLIYLGFAIGFRNVEAARVTIFIKWIPFLRGAISVVLYAVLSGTFFVLMIYTGLQMVRQQHMFTEMASAFPLPMWIVGLVFPLSGLFSLSSLVESLVYSLPRIAITEGDGQ